MVDLHFIRKLEMRAQNSICSAIYVISLLAASGQAQVPDTVLFDNARIIPIEELLARSVLTDTLDHGLTADWLLSMWMIENDLKPRAAAEHFFANMRLKCEAKPPQWWKQTIREFLSKELDVDRPAGGMAIIDRPYLRFANGEMVKMPDEFFTDIKFAFVCHNDNYYCAVGADQSHLTSKVFLIERRTNESRAIVHAEIIPGVWNEDPPTGVRHAMIGLEIVDNRVAIFGDIANTIFVSIYDIPSQTLRLHFVVVGNAGEGTRQSHQSCMRLLA
jgi:hypothetical protein